LDAKYNLYGDAMKKTKKAIKKLKPNLLNKTKYQYLIGKTME